MRGLISAKKLLGARKLLDNLRGRKLKIGLPRDFFIFSSFAKTMAVYHILLTALSVLAVGGLLYRFSITLQEVTLAVTDADKEIVAMMDTYVMDTTVWVLALVCIFAVCGIVLNVYGARRLTERIAEKVDLRGAFPPS